MRIVTAAVMASTLAVSSLSHAAEVGSGDNWHPGEELTQRSTQSHMFDGISLTEHQRQQMRDLMQQARHEQPPVNVSELETMHRLVTAENFDENAVRAQADTIPVFPHMMWGFFLSSICLLLNALQMICFHYTSVS